MRDFETISVEIGEGIGRLTMNRPDSLNALNDKMTTDIQIALKELSADRSVRCVSITGSGRAFSSGQDLKEASQLKSFADSLRKRYHPIIKLVTGMEKPVIALVNGVAAGAGMSLALSCDYRIMTSSSKLIQAFVRIGLVPDSGSTFFLPRFVGYAKAFELAALGEEISSEEALRLGIVNRVFPDNKFVAESEKILARFASGPTKAYSTIKKMLRHSAVYSLEQTLEYEAYMQEISGRTEDAKEATQAFIEKRPPVFRGN